MKRQPMVAAKTERLLNLVIALLYTRRPLTKEQIRATVAAYAETTSTEAFDRMFERDKDELRELGIPLVAEPIDRFFEDEIGYRIDRREYALPKIEFTREELTVLALAARAWEQASLAGPAAAAMRKLAAAGVERDDTSIVGLEPRVRTVEAAFESVRRAVVNAYPITFGYRTGGTGDVLTRRVRPWGLASWHGRWYLTGYDVDRQAPRVFRLGRIRGIVAKAGASGSYRIPGDLDPIAMIAASSADPSPLVARVLVRDGAGHQLRRRATLTATDERPSGSDAGDPGRDTEPGWSLLEVSFAGLEAAAGELAAYGPDVRVLGPPDLVAAVVEQLRSALTAQRDELAEGDDGGVPGVGARAAADGRARGGTGGRARGGGLR